jgi:hypothetical protein
MGKFLDLSGLRVGSLTVTGPCERSRSPRGTSLVFWTCLCDCGKIVKRRSSLLMRSVEMSCGCQTGDKISRTHRRHGMSRSRTYAIWCDMRMRCFTPSHPKYFRWGGRGITVCNRWATFENFLADMGERPPGHSIERIDNDGPYSPENCRWATYVEQARNTRRTIFLTHAGETLPLTEWSERSGIPHGVIRQRHHKGWVDSRAVTEPIRRHRAYRRHQYPPIQVQTPPAPGTAFSAG